MWKRGCDQEAKDHANHGKDGGEDVVEYCLLDRHPGLDEHGKVSDLMGKLMAKDRHTGGEAGHVPSSKSCANGKSEGGKREGSGSTEVKYTNPSARLWMPSPQITIQATLEIFRGAEWRWE